MEAEQSIEAAGESKIHPVSSIGQNVLFIPTIKLNSSSSSSSSASDSPLDISFELNANASSKLLDGINDPLKIDEVHITGHEDPEYKLISDGMETYPMPDLSNAAKTSNLSLSQSSSSASESSLHDHIPNNSVSPSVAPSLDAIVESPKPVNDNDIKYMEPESNKTFPVVDCAHGNTSPGSLGMQPGLSNAAKTSNLSLSQSSSSASESSLHDHIANNSVSPSVAPSLDAIVESPKPVNDNDIKYMEPESNKTFPVVDFAHGNTSPGSLGMQPGPEFCVADDITSHKNLRTSSFSSSSSSLEFETESEPKILSQLAVDTTDKSFAKNPGSPNLEDDGSVLDLSDCDIPISSMPSNGLSPVSPTHRMELSSDSESATQYPATQMMERSEDPNSPAYRIPSRVFSRTRSTAPLEWSVASNESLFSIHMGNMSFTREQLCWLGKSGELCRPGESAMPPFLEVSSNQPPLIVKPCNSGLKGTHLDGDLVVTEATAAETMRQVIMENSENQRIESLTPTARSLQSASLSRQSGGSTKSFQFPILSGDVRKSISLKVDSEKTKQQSRPESPRPPSNPQTPKEESTDQSLKQTPNIGLRKWFACFSCCPFCS